MKQQHLKYKYSNFCNHLIYRKIVTIRLKEAVLDIYILKTTQIFLLKRNRSNLNILLFGLIWFSGISPIVGYLMPNPVFTYILNMICKHFLDRHS